MSSLKYLLMIAGIVTLGTGACADTLDQDGILRNDDGSIHYLIQYKAMNACPGNTHLPTARELAKLSQDKGAKGILEVTAMNHRMVPSGYYLVDAINLNGKRDKFYFNYHGYKRPRGDLGNNDFWSSSIDSTYSNDAYDFSGYSGYVHAYDHRGSLLAVRCVGGAVSAEVTYMTSKGAIFTQVQGPGGFGKAWRDPSGMAWSRYQGDYANNALQPDEGDTVVDSPATEACAKIGGKLPSLRDYFRLVSYFEMDSDRLFLTEQGKKDLLTILPDMKEHLVWWSSTINSADPMGAYGFNSEYYFVDDYGQSRENENSVRCVVYR